MAVFFITPKNGVITGFYHGDIDCDFYGQPQYAHERTLIPDDVSPPVVGDLLAFYDEAWHRKSDVALIAEGLLTMPEGYVREGDVLRKMSAEERIIAGLDEPQPGTKIVDGKIVAMPLSELVAAGLAEIPAGFRLENDQFIEMSAAEKFEAGILSEEEYRQIMLSQNQAELNRRLALLSTDEAKAMAEIDSDYAAQRIAALQALLAVKQQPNWPVSVEWPPEG